MKKILIATIVPFWEQKTGAQQRIFSIVKSLRSDGHRVCIFFPAAAASDDADRIVDGLGIDVRFHRSDQRADLTKKSFFKSLAWHTKAIWHVLTIGISTRLGRWRLEATSHSKSRAIGGKFHSGQRLKDFRWSWAVDAFNQLVDQFCPNVILCEYITTAYLVQGLSHTVRSQTHCMIDTHDLLHRRKAQFQSHGRDHWIDVSASEESKVLQAFDTIIAIESGEAKTMRTMAPNSRVVVVGHRVDADSIGNRGKNRLSGELTTRSQNLIRVGYLGSVNASNVDAVTAFLDSVASELTDQPGLAFVIAGSICDAIQTERLGVDVRLLGQVDNVIDFYDQVDVVVNPVGYGTGLKIKSIEAIAFKKPLLCTPQGWAGEIIGGVVVVPNVHAITKVLKQWAEGQVGFEDLRHRAAAESEKFRDAHEPLLELLRRLPTSGAL